jgi:rare lipoprotein A
LHDREEENTLTHGLTVIVFCALVAGGCASRRIPPPSPSSPSAGSGTILEVREGLASYYADSFNGRTTASGTVFDNAELVAAHPSYPFGSVVRVTNLGNGRAVDVRIVDRGPAPRIRERGVIIDVSRAAAERLGFISAGRTRVRVEVLK